jgi:hypothetical protein
VAADSVGGNRPATVAGPANWTTGRVGGAVSVAGSGSAATTLPVLRTDRSYTVAAWARIDGTPAGDAVVLSQDGRTASGFTLGYLSAQNRWGISLPASDSAGAQRVVLTTTQPPAPGVWTHVAAVYDAASGHLRFYVDGILTGLTPHGAAWHADGPLRIGRALWQGSAAGWWRGAIDDVRVYQGALADFEVAQLSVL